MGWTTFFASQKTSRDGLPALGIKVSICFRAWGLGLRIWGFVKALLLHFRCGHADYQRESGGFEEEGAVRRTVDARLQDDQVTSTLNRPCNSSP